MRLLIFLLLLNSITGYGQSVIVAKSAVRNFIYLKPSLIPGEEYEIVKADPTADKFWLKSKTGDSITTSADYSPDNSIKGPDIQEYFWTKASSDSIKRKYGKVAWKKIVEGKVAIGWSQELCRLSWGEPIRMTQTLFISGTNEQWVYPKAQLFFRNGKLNTIQDN